MPASVHQKYIHIILYLSHEKVQMSSPKKFAVQIHKKTAMIYTFIDNDLSILLQWKFVIIINVQMVADFHDVSGEIQ